jgi:HK97 family phage major capsid protein
MTTIPSSPAELEEALQDPGKLKDLWADPKALNDYIQGYADNFAKADAGKSDAVSDQLREQMRETAQLAVADALKATPEEAGMSPAKMVAEVREQQRANKGLTLSSAERALWNKHAPGVKADGLFDSIAEVFQAAALGKVNFGRGRDKELAAKRSKMAEIMNSFGSEVPADGGFLIPEHLRSELLSVSLETAVVRPRATVIPMDSLRVPVPTIDDTTHVSNVFGGVQWYWTEEAAALTESQASFGRVTLDAKKLTLYAAYPNELVQDAPAFSGFIDAKFPQAHAYGEDVAFFSGTGVGEPLGFLNATAMVSVTKESGQASSTILWENLVKVYARMLPTSLGSCVWIANIETFPQLATMALAVGTGGAPVWIGNLGTQGGGSGAPPASILGRPVIFTEKASALGSAGDISLVDLSYYLIGDRMSVQAMMSDHYLFANDKVAYRLISRVDGRPWLQSAITPHAGSSTLTAFAQIAAR